MSQSFKAILAAGFLFVVIFLSVVFYPKCEPGYVLVRGWGFQPFVCMKGQRP